MKLTTGYKAQRECSLQTPTSFWGFAATSLALSTNDIFIIFALPLMHTSDSWTRVHVMSSCLQWINYDSFLFNFSVGKPFLALSNCKRKRTAGVQFIGETEGYVCVCMCMCMCLQQ